MPSNNYVEIGRVGVLNHEIYYGQIVFIVDVIDQNTVLVDAPDMSRTQMTLDKLSLTDIKTDIGRIPHKSVLISALESADVKNKLERSSWGRDFFLRKKRGSLNVLERARVGLAEIKRREATRTKILLPLEARRKEIMTRVTLESILECKKLYIEEKCTL